MRPAHSSASLSGMTLLEVLIALAIFSTITVFTAQSLRQAIVNKTKIQSQLDEMSQVRDALNIIRRDLEMAFNYPDIEKEYLEAARKQAETLIRKNYGASSPASPQGAPPAAAPGVPNQAMLQDLQKLQERFRVNQEARVSPQTHFKGDEEKVTFVTTHSLNPSDNSGGGNFHVGHMVKVTYQVSDCPLRSERRCLIRHSTYETDGNIENIGPGVALLENLAEFSLRYLGIKQQDWVSTWDSIQGSEAQKNRFPEAIEVNLKVESGEGQTKKSIAMQSVTYPHFVNNPQDKAPQRNQGAGGP